MFRPRLAPWLYRRSWFSRGWRQLDRMLPLPSRTVVLLYHRVSPDPGRDPFHLSVPPRVFASQMEVLRRQFVAVSLSELRFQLKEGRFEQRRQVLVTFDDGYADNYDHALPELRKHRLPAALFLATGYMDRERHFWWDRLADCLFSARTHLDCPWPVNRRLELRDSKERHRELRAVRDQLKPLEETAREECLSALARQAGSRPLESALPLTWERVREMRGEGVEIGGHTRTHPGLGDLSGALLKDEIRNCQEDLRRHLLAPSPFFAYPFGRPGDLHPHSPALLRESGFELAFTTQYGVVAPSCPAPYHLPRLTIRSWMPPEFLYYVTRALQG